MRIRPVIILSCGLALLSGCALGPEPVDNSKVEEATLQRGNPKELFLANFGPPLKDPPAQVAEHAKEIVPEGFSWMSWRIRRLDKGKSYEPSRSGIVNATDSSGASLSMGINPRDTGNFQILFLFAMFDSQDRLVRYIWMEDVDESR